MVGGFMNSSPTVMEQYTIQPIESYTPDEKDFCKFLSSLCEMDVRLGFGPVESWADQKQQIIVIDKREHARALSVATVHKNYSSALTLLAKTLSHLMAHVKSVGEEHDLTFYQNQVDCLLQLMSGVVKSKKALRMSKGKGRIVKNFNKTIFCKSQRVKDFVVNSLKLTKVTIDIVDDKTLSITADELNWGEYLKVMNIFRQINVVYGADIKIERAKNR